VSQQWADIVAVPRTGPHLALALAANLSRIEHVSVWPPTAALYSGEYPFCNRQDKIKRTARLREGVRSTCGCQVDL
jgi:hypothetical protein